MTKYEVIVQSRKSGHSITTQKRASIEHHFEYFQNGRGPKLDAKMVLAEDGTLASYSVRGNQGRGMDVNETFRVENGTAIWKSNEEQGEKTLNGKPAFYMPMASAPALLGLLYDALKKHGGQIELLPSGTATLERESEIRVRDRLLVSWLISGLELAPSRIYTDEQGEYFGTAEEWFAEVPEGWDFAVPILLEHKTKLDIDREKALAANLSKRPGSGGWAITHARVLDIENKRWLEDHTVLVQGAKISALGPSKTIQPPEGATIIDAQGKAVLPGLWDMHTHNRIDDGRLSIAAGITTARDLGNDPDFIDALKQRWDEGSAIGPHLFRSGFIEGRGENAAGSKITAETPEEAKTAVEYYLARGYEGIKIYNSIKPELVPEIVRYAHERGLRVSGHIPAFMMAEEAVRAGYDEIQHLNMVFLNFLADKTTDTRKHLRVVLVGEKAAELDLSSQRVKDFIALLLEKKIAIDPTMVVFELLYMARVGEVLPGMRPLVARLPVQAQRGYRLGGLPIPEGQDETYKKSYAKMLEMIALLHREGVPILAGTDAPGGLTMHRELAIYVDAGLSPADAIYTATLGPARIMGKGDQSGSIAAGKDADLIIVDGDPLSNIADLAKLTTVMKSGIIYSVSELAKSVGMSPL